MAQFHGEVPREAIHRAYLLLKVQTIRMEDELRKMDGKSRKAAEPGVHARRQAMKDIENWWLDINEGV